MKPRTALFLLPIAAGLLWADSAVRRPDSHPSGDGDTYGAQPMKGPQLILEYFRRWHEPYPADLDRATLQRIWSEIAALPGDVGLDSGLEQARGGSAAPWQPLGPFGMDTSQGGRFSGRIVDLNVDESGIRAVAAASGGVWTREAAGWQPKSDELTTQWTGSLDVHPTNSSIMLVGTGEPFLRAGTGLWMTTDGGQSWANKPLSPPPATCFRVRYAEDGTTVHGAFDLGYYRSTNSGETWTRHLDLGAWPTDLALHPTNPDVLFLTVYGQGLFRSTNAGVTWNEVLGTGLPQTDLGRGALTVSGSDPNRIYVAWANTAGTLLGLFRTADGGATWTDVSPHEYMWGQGWYNNTIAVSPVDPDLVLAGGGELLRTTDGGATWTGLSDPALHVDYHAATWSADGTEVWVGHDGGWSRSTDAGLTWDASDNTLSITQYVSIGASATALPVVVGGGSQDNGISMTTDGGASWRFGHGGDGGGFAVDPNDADIMVSTAGLYSGVWTFRRFRSLDGGTSWSGLDSGIGLASQWWIRIRNDLGDPLTWYTYGDEYVYRTTTGFWTGMNSTATAFPHFVSELTASRFAAPSGTVYACLDSSIDGERLRVWDGAAFQERSFGLPSGARLRKVPTHPRKTDWAFALINGMGTPGEKVFRTTDRGINWTNITGSLPDVPLADLVAHPTDDDRLFLGSEMGMFETTDGGTTWERWQLGLPEAAIISELSFVDRFDQTGEFVVIAGTYGRGIWSRVVGPIPTDVPGGPPTNPLGPTATNAATAPTLYPNVPNPFRETTSVSFRLERSSETTVSLLDASGRTVRRVSQGPRTAGLHRIQVDARDLPAGVYFMRVETADGTQASRIVRID